MAVVELESLTKRFGAAAAVDGLTLSIAHGSLVCLLGPSGCGKTTTLRLVAGFMDPDGGTIRVGGRTVSEPGRSVPLPWFLAGGLTPDNVAEAVKVTGARTVDVSSGVESSRGVKSIDLIRAFLDRVKAL